MTRAQVKRTAVWMYLIVVLPILLVWGYWSIRFAAWMSMQPSPGPRNWEGVVESWIMIMVVAFGLAVWAVARLSRNNSIRAARKQAGLCAACGYDLTGTPSLTCPECGKSAA